MYETKIQCDCGSCEAEAIVPQPGAVPTGWIGVTWPERVVRPMQIAPGMAAGVPIEPQPNIEQRTMVFSSWRCVNKHVKSMLAGNGAEASD